jgi:AraC family transcriptional regulator
MTMTALSTAERVSPKPYHGWLAPEETRLPARPVAPETPHYTGGAVMRCGKKSWSGISAILVDLKCDTEIEADISARTARLSVILEETGRPLDIVCPDVPRSSRTQGEKVIAVLAPNARAWIRGGKASFVRHLVLDFHPGLADMIDDPIDLAPLFRTRLAIGDNRLLRICRQFGEECAGHEPANRLYGDGLALALLGRLAALDETPRQKLARGGLSPRQLRCALDYLAANLAENVPLRELAKIAGLSPSHFCRAFKTSTGLAPHQWALNARCDRAKELLVENRLDLAQVAIEVGFSDQSHFTRAFARRVGISPGAWRRERIC